MQVLFAWKAEGVSDVEASQHWNSVVDTWRNTYQQLVDHELCLAATHTGKLFLGLLYVPAMFLEWQEFYEDDSSAVAWVGIAHNLLESIPQKSSQQLNMGFLTKLRESGDSFLREIDGHFVVSVLDRTDQTVRIILNNYGYAPCFRTTGKYGIAVGTRIAPLLDLVGRQPVPNRSGVIHMFAMNVCCGQQTPYEGVSRIEPGEEALLSEHTQTLQMRCHTPLSWILEKRKEFGKEYLHVGSESMISTVAGQLRHSKTPLMNLTGGMDSRAIVATAVSLGYHPECDVSGFPDSGEISIASQAAEVMNVKLHRLYPGEYYTENIEHTLRLWSLWTEGLISAALAFPRSAFALSPKMRQFYGKYFQRFSGLAGELGRNVSYGTEMLLGTLSPDEVYTRIAPLVTNEFLTKEDNALIRNTARANITEGSQLGLQGHHLFNFFLWNELARRWGGSLLDMQHLGRYVFAPFNHPALTSVFFAMTVEEKLACAWHLYHLRRVFPTLTDTPFLKSPLLSPNTPPSREYTLQKKLFRIHPALYKFTKRMKDAALTKYGKRMLYREEDKAGTYFHPYLRQLLFSGEEWWPSVIQYKQGKRIWERFVKYKESVPLWALASIELWARNFLR